MFNSLDLVIIFSREESFLISFIFASSLASHLLVHVAHEILAFLNSFKVLHSLQKPHCHCHFNDSFQQLLHRYIN
ncbi:hypothetical protein HOB94_01930 [bacterium]|nr:hypothetical protein [bacterium]MBT4632754.1 hypothetical protein [bacterium]